MAAALVEPIARGIKDDRMTALADHAGRWGGEMVVRGWYRAAGVELKYDA